MIEFKFDEEFKIRTAVELKKLSGVPVRKAIWTLALYYTKLCGHKKDDVYKDIVCYIGENLPGVYYEEYIADIERCIRRAAKYELKKVDNIQIRQSEMDIVQRYSDTRKQKITFVLIALAKYFNALYKNDANCLWAKTSEIFKMARVSIAAKERNLFLSYAYEDKILVPNLRIGQNLMIVGVVSNDEDDPVVLELNEGDYLDLAYSYLNYKTGHGYKRCLECGRWFKIIKKQPGRKYCFEHTRAKEPMGTKERICQDCGEKFVVSAKDNHSKWCSECAEKHNTNLPEKFKNEQIVKKV